MCDRFGIAAALRVLFTALSFCIYHGRERPKGGSHISLEQSLHGSPVLDVPFKELARY